METSRPESAVLYCKTMKKESGNIAEKNVEEFGSAIMGALNAMPSEKITVQSSVSSSGPDFPGVDKIKELMQKRLQIIFDENTGMITAVGNNAEVEVGPSQGVGELVVNVTDEEKQSYNCLGIQTKAATDETKAVLGTISGMLHEYFKKYNNT